MRINSKFVARVLAVCVGLVATVSVASAADLPFRIATAAEANSLTGSTVVKTTLSQTNFNTAATVTVKKPSTASSSKTLRAAQARSAVYKVALSAGTDPNPHPVPPEVQPGDLVHHE
jgi:hypothetical protein